MDKNAFTNSALGKLVEIPTPAGKDWAFVPNELPLKWEFDHDLYPLLVEAHKALGTLNGIGQILPDPQLLLRPLQNQEAISSSKIEGTIVTAQQLLLFELNPTEGGKPTDRASDWLEVYNYRRALRSACDDLKSIPICNRLIRSAHAILMGGVRGKDKAPGDFRKLQVQIGSSGHYIPPPSNEVENLMGNLETYLNKGQPELDPLVRCFIVHYQFESIHPFMDGNGRIGRLLLALMIYKWLNHKKPWLYMSAFFDKFKNEYMNGLYRTSTEGAMTKWLELCLRGTVQQANDSIRRCTVLNDLRAEFHQKANDSSPSPRTHKIIEDLLIDPIVRVSALASKLDISYQTAKTDLEMLVKNGIIQELEGVKPKTYYCQKIFSAAYSEELPNS
jgi:Fic family protein